MDHLRVGFADNALLIVPGGALQEEAIEVAAVFRAGALSHGFICKLEDLVGEVDLVDRVLVLPGKVLLDSCQERLGEEETGDPKDVWLSALDPLLEHRQAPLQVFHVAQ